jgi:hypothetical protein
VRAEACHWRTSEWSIAGYTTRFDWRPEVEQGKIYVDNYLVDSQIAGLPRAGAIGS